VLGGYDKLINTLSLDDYFRSFQTLLARDGASFILDGDRSLHFRFLNELQKHDFNPPPPIQNLDDEMKIVTKNGVISKSALFAFCKIVSYFNYLKNISFEGPLSDWISNIVVPEEIKPLTRAFDKNGEFLPEFDEPLSNIVTQISSVKKDITRELTKAQYTEKLQPYLVDKQLHLINGEETLLVRSGFSVVLRAKIVSRSASGFFYVVPQSISNLQNRYEDLLTAKEEAEYALCKKLSNELSKHILFCKFINSAFDRFDKYQARVFFARSHDYIFIEPKNSQKILLKEFVHPAIKLAHAVPFSIDFSKKTLIITGVNAGGKTMLLKSIISATFLAKYLMPMRINEQSHIGSFGKFKTIIDDPQNVKYDISTFAGRIREFSEVLRSEPMLIGVDEIELGTDSEEASALFKSILEKLQEQNHKVVVTTHHKKLAILMSSNEQVELSAAIYDEKAEKPTFEFLQGLIGKSYAFETALKYGVPKNIIESARITYGEDKQKISDIVEKSSSLQSEMKSKIDEMAKEAQRLRFARHEAEVSKEAAQKEFDKAKLAMELEYKKAIEIAKNAAKTKDQKEIHRALNETHKIVKNISHAEQKQIQREKIVVGDTVKYGQNICTVLEITKTKVSLDADGKRFFVESKLFFERAKKSNHANILNNHKGIKISVEKPTATGIKIDLHGMRVEEALEVTDKFLSDSILAGFHEVYIYHGIGSGRLAGAVKEFLKTHPIVQKFVDAAPNKGGYGATIVYF
jgi:DNA mismatch repair protein MutS2